jgi:large subunit ribosomal protein L15
MNMFKLTEIKPKANSRFRRKRVGRGESSGMGKTCGRGTKGQQSRSGGGFYVGFEGGQNPLYKRIPKLKGFKNHLFRNEFSVINVEQLSKLSDHVITPELLKEKGLVRQNAMLVKILGEGVYKGSATIKAHKFSGSAQEKITKAGGKTEVLPMFPVKEKIKKAPKANKK